MRIERDSRGRRLLLLVLDMIRQLILLLMPRVVGVGHDDDVGEVASGCLCHQPVDQEDCGQRWKQGSLDGGTAALRTPIPASEGYRSITSLCAGRISC